MQLSFKPNTLFRSASLKIEIDQSWAKNPILPHLQKYPFGTILHNPFVSTDHKQNKFAFQTDLLRNVTWTNNLQFEIAKFSSNQQQMILLEKQDEFLFGISYLTTSTECLSNQSNLSKQLIAVFFDTSLSRNPNFASKYNIHLEFDLLQTLLVANPNTAIDFYCFSDSIKSVQTVTSLEDLKRLEQQLEKSKINFEGATNFQEVLNQLWQRNEANYKLAIVFSDGFGSFGMPENELFDLIQGYKQLSNFQPIYSFSTHVKTNHSFLRRLTVLTGGFFSELSESSQLHQLASSISSSPFSLLNVKFDPNVLQEGIWKSDLWEKL